VDYDDTLAYVKERKQFGRPIGSWQALQDRLAEARWPMPRMVAPKDEALGVESGHQLHPDLVFNGQKVFCADGRISDTSLSSPGDLGDPAQHHGQGARALGSTLA
jgi:hypothetical protein